MNNNDVMEIDLVQLMLLCVRKLKTIILVAVVFALIMAGYKGMKGIASLKSADVSIEETEGEDSEKERYETAKAAYEDQLKRFGDMIAANNAYKDASILMQLDSNNYFSAGNMYYISTDYQIMPEMTYQDIDYTDDVIQSYILYMMSSECLNYVRSKLTEDVSLRCLKELINVSQSSHIINVEVIADTSERVNEILEALNEAVMLHKDQIDNKVYKHDISLIDKSKAGNISETEITDEQAIGDAGYVQSKQAEFANQQNDLINKYDAVYTKLNNLTEPKAKGADVGFRDILKSCVKFGIIGGFAGAFLAALVICIRAVMIDAVNNAQEVTRLFGVTVFGDYKAKKTSNKFSNILYKMSYGDATADRTDFLNVLSANIGAYLNAFKDKDIKEISFVGRLGADEMKEIAKAVNETKESDVLRFAGDILTDAEAINAISDKKYMMVALDRNTPKADLRKQLEKLKGLEKTVIGAVLYN